MLRHANIAIICRLAFIVFALSLCAATSPAPHPAQRATFQSEVNPLTGLPIADPQMLNRRPMLVKVSNQSYVIRPQSGLSFADQVWEHQLEGFEQTRFTAVFYSQTPKRVGSVRSTRPIDVEHLVPMYGGLLVTSGGSSNRSDPGGPPRIEELLSAQAWARRVVSTSWIGDQAYEAPYLMRNTNLPRPGTPHYHALFAFPARIWAYMDAQGLDQRPDLGGLAFADDAPAGGVPTAQASIDYPGRGPRHVWRYDAASRRWLSWTEDQNTRRRKLQRDLDLLTWQPLAFDNVVIVYADHYESNFLEDEAAGLLSVGVNLLGEGRAILLRNGQRYECVWRRGESGRLIQFFDANGQPIPFKPGTTWFNLSDTTQHSAEVVFAP